MLLRGRFMGKQFNIQILLGFRTTFADNRAFEHLPNEIRAVFDKSVLQWIAWLFPTGRLHVHHDGKGRRYIDLRCEVGRAKRIPVARLILCLLGEPEQKNRRAHHRDGDWCNFLPENLYLGGSGHYAGSDDTWQEVARRSWARENGLEPDGRAPEIIGEACQPPRNDIGPPMTFPPIPVRMALRERMLKGGRSGNDN